VAKNGSSVLIHRCSLDLVVTKLGTLFFQWQNLMQTEIRRIIKNPEKTFCKRHVFTFNLIPREGRCGQGRPWLYGCNCIAHFLVPCFSSNLPIINLPFQFLCDLGRFKTLRHAVLGPCSFCVNPCLFCWALRSELGFLIPNLLEPPQSEYREQHIGEPNCYWRGELACSGCALGGDVRAPVEHDDQD
jgi:hypothetical protein